MDFDAVADELYRLRPEEFTAARDARAAQARKAGERGLADRVKALRKPVLAAWAANLLVREHPDQAEALLGLGEALRRAQQGLSGEELRELSAQRRVLVSALLRQVERLTARAGQPVGREVLDAVNETLHAVLADPAAAREWATGRLVRPLSAPVGFGGGAPAGGATVHRLPTAASSGDRRPGRAGPVTDLEEARHRRERQRLRRVAAEAAAELRTHQEELAAARDACRSARARRERAERDLARLSARLTDARAEESAAEARLREITRTTDAAHHRATRAATEAGLPPPEFP
ncbi:MULTISPECIES: hypothetical protein [Streptomycetaceae]|uniref:Uncharacterized protein n=1 Tax=Streptantibioticus cattleyicolor (strain ATCC 35852 / DSM 46488 / JCM 4925 / NBRC 14057 / NRRL 8057) TaxID=1003195 RepID=G8WYM8_STREN|nr:hypothetical protein [Streptantibioticus cattleyicolor]AEW92419.1 hypothetical protein SCATT_00480 [Streptantibioticus cattleyicolor NRRL 8057 = DSM 46488]MYS57228.1 hypothetical protein [Streptomyces sp. SID5468]